MNPLGYSRSNVLLQVNPVAVRKLVTNSNAMQCNVSEEDVRIADIGTIDQTALQLSNVTFFKFSREMTKRMYQFCEKKQRIEWTIYHTIAMTRLLAVKLSSEEQVHQFTSDLYDHFTSKLTCRLMY